LEKCIGNIIEIVSNRVNYAIMRMKGGRAKKSLQKGPSSKIKIRNIITKVFKVTKRLRQGCSLSTTLFKIHRIPRTSVKELEREMPTNGYTNSKQNCILTQFC